MEDNTEVLSHDQLACRVQYLYDYMQRLYSECKEWSPEEDDEDATIRRSRMRVLEDLLDVLSEAFDGVVYYG